MSFSSLLCHSALVSRAVRTNVDGRIAETWQILGMIPCRFSNPATGTTTIVDGAAAPKIDATVFTGPELDTLIAGSDLPVRLITTDPGIAGTYELLRPIRLYCRKTSEIHHCECDCRKVQI